MKKKRSPLLALILSTSFLPGLGQLYNGQHKRFFFIQALNIGLAISAFFLLNTFFGLLIWISLSILVFLLNAIDAVVQARKLGSVELRWYQKWYLYAAVAVVGTIVAGLVSSFAHENYFEAFKIPSSSMEPTLVIGDHVLTIRQPYKNSPPSRGDLVVFNVPVADSSELSVINYAKRIVGLPGERIAVRGTSVFINEKEVEEPYARWLHGGVKDFPETEIPENSVFVLGDNRDFSKDSRYYPSPFIPIDQVKAKLAYIYWNTLDTRRIGKTLH